MGSQMFSDVLQTFSDVSDSCAELVYFWASSNESIGIDDPKEFDDPQFFDDPKGKNER